MDTIRSEVKEDILKIQEIHMASFPTEDEAKLVNALRDCRILIISLVAEMNHSLIGHIGFSPVSLVTKGEHISILGLAPMAVLPDHQKMGTGTMLVKEGLKRCIESGYDAIVVLGHPKFYSRFGFVPSVNFNIKSEYDVPDEVFMIQELKKGVLKNKKGVIKYHSIFNQIGGQ